LGRPGGGDAGLMHADRGVGDGDSARIAVFGIHGARHLPVPQHAKHRAPLTHAR
jgi:hypothetical protein